MTTLVDLSLDANARAISIRLATGEVARTLSYNDDQLRLQLDDSGTVVGVELLNVATDAHGALALSVHAVPAATEQELAAVADAVERELDA